MIRSALIAVMLLVAIAQFKKADRGRTVEPATGGEAVAREMRAAFCEKVSLAAEEFSGRVRDGEFKDEATEAKAWSEIAGKIAKDVTGKTSADTAAMYAKARALPEDKALEMRADYYLHFGRGMK